MKKTALIVAAVAALAAASASAPAQAYEFTVADGLAAAATAANIAADRYYDSGDDCAYGCRVYYHRWHRPYYHHYYYHRRYYDY
ncbi:MAG: hypothetical protein KGK16_16795 [Bradyrhizobium sp.]|uniref:hypothetical protein n=1 Tax=Bradyrhizobium sp. TaxID=376 RepID=UPI001EB28EB9|nr:hypothetical protein [Bradyrhizobium sp.]MBU6457009.1 hypothetical protein [Bradyrhizobium sp.]MDE2332421.1 hypothetical protein [Bradyrhizobium sp.]MDE2603157.1 hypothetical protein [Bradyrhizobium sp.]